MLIDRHSLSYEDIVIDDHSLSYEDIVLRVKRGAEYLDKEYPHWEGLINLDVFDITNADSCVLGQIDGFGRMLTLLNMNGLSSYTLGFNLEVDGEDPDNPEAQGASWVNAPNAWNALQQAWLEFIEGRQR